MKLDSLRENLRKMDSSGDSGIVEGTEELNRTDGEQETKSN